MVSFQTAEIYNEDEDNIIGVKVKVSADNGQVIDEIQVTNKTALDELEAKLDVLDEKFVQFDDGSGMSGMSIDNILQNISETIEINATELGGIQSDGYAKANHTHDDRYYTESEVNTKLNQKAAAVHTHDDRYYTETEIDTKLNGKSNTDHTHAWTRQNCTSYGSLYINPTLRLCELKYYRQDYTLSQEDTFYTLHKKAIPDAYLPKGFNIVPCLNTSINFIIQNDGDIVVTASSRGTKTINTSVMWHY